MKLKKIAAALSAALLAGSPVSAQAGQNWEFPDDAVIKIHCGQYVGTAFHIGGGTYVTAFHVVSHCLASVPGLRADVEHDFATFAGPVLPDAIRISCRRYQPGEMYVAAGYPGEGGDYLAKEPVVAVDYRIDGIQTFVGNMEPGMSGGAVIDSRGLAHGWIDMRWPARSIEFRETFLCDKDEN